MTQVRDMDFGHVIIMSTYVKFNKRVLHLAPVVQSNNFILRINRYPVDCVVCFVKSYSLDSDLSSG